jgi:hypothetical protein
MRVPIVILALVASPFLTDVSAQSSKQAARKDSDAWQWFQKIEDKWKGWLDKKDDKCDKKGKGKDDRRGSNGRGHDDDRCDSSNGKPTPTPAPTPGPTPAPTPGPVTPPAAAGAEISGLLYSDLNFNGARDAGEPVLAGWTVEIVGGPSVVTDNNGVYKFSAVSLGSYTVCATAQMGWSQIMPSRGEMCDSGAKGFLIDVLADAPSAVFSARDFGFTSASGG